MEWTWGQRRNGACHGRSEGASWSVTTENKSLLSVCHQFCSTLNTETSTKHSVVSLGFLSLFSKTPAGMPEDQPVETCTASVANNGFPCRNTNWSREYHTSVDVVLINRKGCVCHFVSPTSICSWLYLVFNASRWIFLISLILRWEYLG